MNLEYLSVICIPLKIKICLAMGVAPGTSMKEAITLSYKPIVWS
jgi:hypothetical protein